MQSRICKRTHYIVFSPGSKILLRYSLGRFNFLDLTYILALRRTMWGKKQEIKKLKSVGCKIKKLKM